MIGKKRIVHRTRATDKKDYVFRFHHQAGQWVLIGGKKNRVDEDFTMAAKRVFKEQTALSLDEVALPLSPEEQLETMHRAYVLVMAKIKPEYTLKKVSEMINNNLANVDHYLLKKRYLHQELATTKVVSYRHIRNFLGKFNGQEAGNKRCDNIQFIEKTYYLCADNTYTEKKPEEKFMKSYRYVPILKEDMLFQERLREHDIKKNSTDLMYNSMENHEMEKCHLGMQSLFYDRGHAKQNLAWCTHMATCICFCALGIIRQ